MGEVERATREISCRSCDPTKPGEVIPESPTNGLSFSSTVLFAGEVDVVWGCGAPQWIIPP
jgi:hypothetical protein